MRVQLSMVCVALAAVGISGCQGRLAYNLPPSSRLMHPGPGVDGPGPGVIPVGQQMIGGGTCGVPGGAVPGSAVAPGCTPCPWADASPADTGIQQCQYCDDGACYDGASYGGACYDGGCDDGACYGGPGYGGAGYCGPSTSQIAFLGESGIQVQWDVSGHCLFDSVPLLVPARQDFPQGAIYRLKVSNIPGRPAVSLYPTLEVAPVTPRTDAYLAHAPIPVQFTEEDFDQVLSGNFVTKVIYLPDPEFQELALAGVETLVSTRLDPGIDPIAEADRRGSILAILRMGSKDLSCDEGRGGFDPRVQPAAYQFGDEQGLPTLGPTPQNGYGPADGGNYVESDPFSDEYVGQYPDDGQAYGAFEGDVALPPVDGNYSDYYGGGTGGCIPGAGTPLGMPTAGFQPTPTPPHLIAGMGPTWGMPMSGTPIGLPGPPHIPHGSPAGLQKHVMKNRTRMHIPPPVDRVRVSVKQRPGMNYPQPVHKVMVDETARQPLNLRGGTLPPLVPQALRNWQARRAANAAANCQYDYCR